MKLSGTQLLWIIVTTEIVALVGLRVTPAIEIAKQDAWLAMLVGGVIGLAFILLFVHLSLLHPNQTLTQFSQALLGNWLGRIIVIPYYLAWYMKSAFFLRSFSEFLRLIILDKTPVWTIMLLLLVVVIYLTTSSGINGIGRLCEVIGPIIILALLVSILLSLTNLNWKLIMPFYSDSGWANILKASLDPAIWFSGPFTLLVIVAFVKPPGKVLSKSMLGVGILASMVSLTTLMPLLVFGPNLSSNMRFSYFLFIKTIDILNFIQNVDIFIVFLWIFGVFSQLALYFFVFSSELSRWFNVKNWRKFIWFTAPLIFITGFSTTVNPILYDRFWSAVVFPVCGVGIPLLLWIITLIKRKSMKLQS